MKKRMSSISSQFKHLDYFTETINWRHSKGETAFKTYAGASLTVSIGLMLFAFAAIRFVGMISKKDFVINE